LQCGKTLKFGKKKTKKSKELPIKATNANSEDVVYITVSAFQMQTPYCHRL